MRQQDTEEQDDGEQGGSQPSETSCGAPGRGNLGETIISKRAASQISAKVNPKASKVDSTGLVLNMLYDSSHCPFGLGFYRASMRGK
jgi:hypothetical protein